MDRQTDTGRVFLTRNKKKREPDFHIRYFSTGTKHVSFPRRKSVSQVRASKEQEKWSKRMDSPTLLLLE
jgi:hypothetical protein